MKLWLAKDSIVGEYKFFRENEPPQWRPCSNGKMFTCCGSESKLFGMYHIENIFPCLNIKEPFGQKLIEILPIENGYTIREVKPNVRQESNI